MEGKSAALQALCWQDIPGVMVNAETYFLTQVTSKEQEHAVAQEGKPASAILPQAEKIWESHQLEARKALSSKSPGWEGQHSPTGAAGAILQQHKAPPRPGRSGREPPLPSSLRVQRDCCCHRLPRKGKDTLWFWLL